MPPFDITTFLSTLSHGPGVYRMLNAQDEVLYIGKARDLKKRVSQYFRTRIDDPKTAALMAAVARIEVTLTASENEALILENNLIKSLQPHFNILLKDDKSYPYLYLSNHPDFPRMDVYRGAQNLPGHYFGPYPGASSVRETLDLLQKLFKIRQCSDPFFKSRTRPCLQYQIKRCTAPCVGFVDVPAYQQQVHLAVMFLQGKNAAIVDELLQRMEQASQDLAFEEAARIRDQVVLLRRIQEQQYVDTGEGDVDCIAILQKGGVACVHLLFIRNGRLIGNKPFFIKPPRALTDAQIIAEFLPQYYFNANRGGLFPKRIIVSTPLEERAWIESALSEQLGKKITLSHNFRGKQRQWMNMALLNAQQGLTSYLADKYHNYQRFESLQQVLGLANIPQRIDCFDVSHTMGEATVAACVVFDAEGARKQDYRRYNVVGLIPGDDYGALTHALTRRYSKLKLHAAQMPDILVIDGGKGQLSRAEAVFQELQISSTLLLAIAKGPERKAGLETIFISGQKEPFVLEPDSPAFYLLQHIRDEAHRFAITGHRQQRAKKRAQSVLEQIPGVGKNRRRELLRWFGGLQEIRLASIEELAKVPGISKALATTLYKFLRKDEH